MFLNSPLYKQWSAGSAPLPTAYVGNWELTKYQSIENSTKVQQYDQIVFQCASECVLGSGKIRVFDAESHAAW